MSVKTTSASRALSGDGGFTVIELSIVMVIAMVIMSSLLALLASQSSAAARIEKFVNDQEQVRLAFVALQRDLRSAESIVLPSPESDPNTRIDLETYTDPTATALTTIRWRITETNELVREHVLSEHEVVVTYSLDGVSNATTGMPLLRYYGPNSDSPHNPAGAATTIANCTVRIGIDLRAAPSGGDAEVHLASDVQIRNRILEGRQC